MPHNSSNRSLSRDKYFMLLLSVHLSSTGDNIISIERLPASARGYPKVDCLSLSSKPEHTV